MTSREPVILGHRSRHDRGQGRAGHPRTDGCWRSPAAGYDLDTSGGPGWAEQDPGAWWSAVVGAVRGLRPAEPVDVVAIAGRRPWPDARRRGRPGRGDAAGDHVPRYPRHRRGRGAGRGDRRSRLGAGRPAGGRSGSSGTSPRVAAATRWYLSTWEWLALRLVGRGDREPGRGPTRAGPRRGCPRRACPAAAAASGRSNGRRRSAG